MIMARNVLVLFLLLSNVAASFAQMEERFYNPSKKLDPIDVPYKEYNFYIWQDTINTILLTSTHKKPKYTFIYFHGSGGNVTRYVKLVTPLTEAGYQVLMIDLRGYGKSSGKLTHQNAVTDAEYVFSEIRKMKSFKKQNFIVYGASLGSQVAARFTENQQQYIKALVLDGPMSSLTEIAAASMPEAQRESVRKFLKFPYDAKTSVKNIKIPLLVIHSEDDERVPFIQGKDVFDNANEPKYFWQYKGGHLQAPILEKEEFIKQMNSLLKR
jgi:uncharacterized protein